MNPKRHSLDRRDPLHLALVLLSFLALLGVTGPAAADDPTARRAIHLLDYIAVDYPDAVRDGAVVSELEYAEQLEFTARVAGQLEQLGLGEDDPLRTRLAALERAIGQRADEEQVSGSARSLAAALRDRFDVRALPREAPSPEEGRQLFVEACASCHGAAGQGDGPAAAGLDPAPSDLTDRARMLGLSPFAVLSTLTYGIEGTAMAGFADRFDESQLYDLAFYVSGLALEDAERERGRQLAAAAPAELLARVPGLESLIHRSAGELASDPDGLAWIAYLRANPTALERGDLPIGIALGRLDASWLAYRDDRRQEALDLAISAYLDGFEHAEPAVSAVDAGLRAEVESAFLRYRAALGDGDPTERVEPLYASLRSGLLRADEKLSGDDLGPAAVFVGSLTIAAREGLEAVLLVVALCGILIRADRRDALRYVHLGWSAALVAGAATWWMAIRLVEVSGASREVIEGVSALLATAILFYVSYWLVSKVESARWQAFLDTRIKAALGSGSLGLLAFLSFVAVYREILETALFYQALSAQAGPEGRGALWAGVGVGVVVLAALAVVVFRFGQRLPMRRFFAASSALLYGLAIVLAGQGIAALQEAGWLPATWVPLVRIEWLGIYPTLEGLALQCTLALAALVALPWLVGWRSQATA